MLGSLRVLENPNYMLWIEVEVNCYDCPCCAMRGVIEEPFLLVPGQMGQDALLQEQITFIKPLANYTPIYAD